MILNVYIDTWHGSGSQNTLELKEFSAAFFSDWPKQPRAVQVMPSNPHHAYNKTLTETATPRQLEEQFLLKAAATLQRVLDSWTDKPSGLNEAVLYNRRLWIVLVDAVIRDDNKLPIAIRQNVLNIGAFVMAETFSLMTKPEPEHLASIIRINRRIAAGLRGKAVTHDAPQAA